MDARSHGLTVPRRDGCMRAGEVPKEKDLARCHCKFFFLLQVLIRSALVLGCLLHAASLLFWLELLRLQLLLAAAPAQCTDCKGGGSNFFVSLG